MLETDLKLWTWPSQLLKRNFNLYILKFSQFSYRYTKLPRPWNLRRKSRTGEVRHLSYSDHEAFHRKRPFVGRKSEITQQIVLFHTHAYRCRLRKPKAKEIVRRAMLRTIKEDCLENLKGSEAGDNAVFLISNLYPAKWDFGRLTQAILDVLPYRQRECLTLSLGVLTSLSTDMLKRKADLLRGKYEKRTSWSAPPPPPPNNFESLHGKSFSVSRVQWGKFG